MGNLIERHHPVNVGKASVIASNADLFNGDPTTTPVKMTNWRQCLFLIQKGAGALGTATITVESCSDNGGTGATAIKFKYRKQISADTWTEWAEITVVGFTTDAGADQLYQICVEGGNLVEGHTFVQMVMTEVVDMPVNGSVFALMAEPRFADDVPQTVLS